MLRLCHSEEQHYTTFFNTETGFFARIEDEGYPEPKWAARGPELVDIAITNWCDQNCDICYRRSDPRGQHMSATLFQNIIKQCEALGVLQIALGGGNPNQHPRFTTFLKIARDANIVPSYTTNGQGLTKDIVEASAKLCGAVAVSYHVSDEQLATAIRVLLDSGVKTNVHFVLDSQSLDEAIEWITNPPPEIQGINALIFLTYKPVARKEDPRRRLRSGSVLRHFMKTASEARVPFRIGFDSCLVPALVRYTAVAPICFDACEAGRFSMFISEAGLAYPCSFMEAVLPGESVVSSTIKEIWASSELFQKTRATLLNPRCKCQHEPNCLGGCPVFPEINCCT